MGNRNSSARASTTSSVLTSCCKCRTYSIDGPDNDVGHNGAAAAAPAPNSVEMNERQPVAPGSEEPVDNQPPTENPHANLPESESPGMSRLPRPPRNPIGKPFSSTVFLFSFVWMACSEVGSVSFTDETSTTSSSIYFYWLRGLASPTQLSPLRFFFFLKRPLRSSFGKLDFVVLKICISGTRN